MEGGPVPVGGYDIPPAPEPTKALTAFLIVVGEEGQALAYSDVNMPLKLQREPSLNEMYAACAQVMKDVQILQLAPHVASQTINGMLQAMAQQAQMVADAKIKAKLREKGLRVP